MKNNGNIINMGRDGAFNLDIPDRSILQFNNVDIQDAFNRDNERLINIGGRKDIFYL